MSNVLAIAGKELRSYFASPIAYIVIGLFAAIFGFFYSAMLEFFLQRSQQMTGMGPAVNVNQDMIRYILTNASVVVLFVLPMITMRTYSEEKRSGTI
jgi:ABC-2 type transport system permease protein